MSEKIPSKADALRAMREAAYEANHSRGVGRGTKAKTDKPKPAPWPAHAGVAPSPREANPVAKATKGKSRSAGNAKKGTRKIPVTPPAWVVSRLSAGRTAQDVPQPPPAVAVAIPKLGRPRLGEERSKPWLHTNPPMSKTTWYRRKAEGKLPCDGPVSTTGKS